MQATRLYIACLAHAKNTENVSKTTLQATKKLFTFDSPEAVQIDELFQSFDISKNVTEAFKSKGVDAVNLLHGVDSSLFQRIVSDIETNIGEELKFKRLQESLNHYHENYFAFRSNKR